MSAARVRGPVPDRVSLRAYDVGFGDCLLLTFTYRRAPGDDGRRERHVLVDMGTIAWPPGAPRTWRDVAGDLADRTGGRLDALVLSHRHQDHLSGLAHDDAFGAIGRLRPRLVVRPWTDGPDARRRGDRRNGNFVARLAEAEALAAEVERRLPADAHPDLRRLSAARSPVETALERIDRLAADAELGPRYVHAGTGSGIEDAVPGVSVEVLGPPTPRQLQAVPGDAHDVTGELWLAPPAALRRMLDDTAAPAAVRAARVARRAPEPGPVRWLVERLTEHEARTLLGAVQSVHVEVNNTSVVLLFRAGRRRLLFSGDAEIRSWRYALAGPDAPRLSKLLADVDLYKVGHHGSRNATPRSLVGLWRRGRLTSVLSTLPGVQEREGSEIPRGPLVEALAELGPVYRTDAIPGGRPYVELSAATGDRRPFAPTPSG